MKRFTVLNLKSVSIDIPKVKAGVVSKKLKNG